MKTLKLGFTGTQSGMSERQKAKFVSILKDYEKEYDKLEAHHGDCIGADSDFHDLCVQYWGKDLVTVSHPPINPKKRAWKKATIILPEKDYIPRNHDIVDAVDIMIATPETAEEKLRSGTWATVRYARKTKTVGRVLKP